MDTRTEPYNFLALFTCTNGNGGFDENNESGTHSARLDETTFRVATLRPTQNSLFF